MPADCTRRAPVSFAAAVMSCCFSAVSMLDLRSLILTSFLLSSSASISLMTAGVRPFLPMRTAGSSSMARERNTGSIFPGSTSFRPQKRWRKRGLLRAGVDREPILPYLQRTMLPSSSASRLRDSVSLSSMTSSRCSIRSTSALLFPNRAAKSSTLTGITPRLWLCQAASRPCAS